MDAAIAAGADALGFVFYAASARSLTAHQAARLVRRVPPFVSSVGLFVNAAATEIEAILAAVPLSILQFHGDETAADCARWQRPWIKAARVTSGLNLVQYAAEYSTAQALLLDSHVAAYGGAGQSFDWSLIPRQLALPIVLAGGLDADNVGAAIRQVRPAAVDVSSGVEQSKGIKDQRKLRAFIAAVRAAESSGTEAA